MTRNESFKRRIRDRMAATGERYGAARRTLIAQADARPSAAGSGRAWVAEPVQTDAVIREATGRGWDDWADLLDAWPGNADGHTAIATHVRDDLGVDGWWAQAVTVGYERITGRRLPNQRPDGTFSAGKSRTVTIDAVALRDALLDEDDRAELFPGIDTELRSRPTSKNVRLRVGPGTAELSLEPRDDGRVRITVAHEKLPDPGDVDVWKAYWDEWLEAVDQS